MFKLILIICFIWLCQSTYINAEPTNTTITRSYTDSYKDKSIQNSSKFINNQNICKQLKEAKNEIEVEFKQLEHNMIDEIFYSGMKTGKIHKNQLKQFINKCK